jgi:hypothetical protein
MTYADMVGRVALALGERPQLVHLPLSLLKTAAALASWLPRWRHVTSGMVERMNQDLVFDSEPARRDFGYAPGPFRFSEEPAARQRRGAVE